MGRQNGRELGEVRFSVGNERSCRGVAACESLRCTASHVVGNAVAGCCNPEKGIVNPPMTAHPSFSPWAETTSETVRSSTNAVFTSDIVPRKMRPTARRNFGVRALATHLLHRSHLAPNAAHKAATQHHAGRAKPSKGRCNSTCPCYQFVFDDEVTRMWTPRRGDSG